MPAKNEFDPLAPRTEAAMFYGLFLRGHSPELLKEEIDVPKSLLEKWMTSPQYAESTFRESVQRVYRYRKLVLAIFEELVSNERVRIRVQ
jgi:hypothetical protein